MINGLFLAGLMMVSLVGCHRAGVQEIPATHQAASPADEVSHSSEKGAGLMGVHGGHRPVHRIHKKPRACWTRRSPGNVFILAMGSNMGDTDANRLRWTHKDAERFAEAMRQLFGLRDKSRVCVLDNVTQTEFVQALKRLGQLVTPNDLVIIFYSGHGTRGNDKNKDERDRHDELFVLYSEQANCDAALLRDDDFSRLINHINTNNILTFIDACFSAGLSKGDESSERVKFCGNAEFKQGLPPFDATLDEPVKGVLLSAALENQKAIELNGRCEKTNRREKYRGGRFTLFFLEALERARRKQRRVDLLEVFKQTKAEVKKHSEKCSKTTQEPDKKGKNAIFQRINRFIPQ